MSTSSTTDENEQRPAESAEADQRRAWTEFLSKLSPRAREQITSLADRNRDEDSSPATPATTGSCLTELVSAADKADLIGVELKLVIEVAKKMGKAKISDLELALEKDVLSALKRAKPKMRKVHWDLHRHDSHIIAKPLPSTCE